MNSRSVREDLDSWGSLAGLSGAMAEGPLREHSFVLFEIQKRRREDEEMDKVIIERLQELESLRQSTEEKEAELKKQNDLCLSFDTFLKEEEAEKAAERTEKESKEVLQLEAKLERLKLKYAELMKEKQEQERQIQIHCVYKDFMVRLIKITKFDDIHALAGHIESLLHLQDLLYQRDKKTHEQVDHLKKSLLTLEDRHRLLRLQKTNRLSQLQTEIEQTCSEALSWERKWNTIQETAANKTLLLGRIKMATHNLYEMTANEVGGGEEDMNMNDTEKQLEKVKMFMQDHEYLAKHNQTPSHDQAEQEKDKSKHKKCTATRA
ncbi:coiled-coil domain-containing protein 42 homolog [Anoplopoma fimbria]|uniref:coiled-coil domain-containing protein 42 homolog n=1 Tax=Anoplopoma fimbria TaxID=229290 RepID=UPI0023EBF57F|nr:coiled-coil domain-containing protein 42 homolog [Anoplopoma fimbria]